MKIVSMNDELEINNLTGNRPAQKKLVETYYPGLLNFINKLVPNRQDAEEIANDCFLKIFEKSPFFESSQKFSGYLYQMARNRIISFDREKKGKKKLPVHPVEFHEIEGSVDDELAGKIIEDQWINSFLQEIKMQPSKRQEVLRRYYIDGNSQTEIAGHLEIHRSTVQSHIKDFEEHLKQKFGHLPFDLPPTI